MNPAANKADAGIVDVIVIGAGHSGLAMSHFLSAQGIDHLVLERGQIANTWRHERWDSLRLLTPNWQSQLPGHAYTGSNPDGYMHRQEVVDFISTYAERMRAPVITHIKVESVQAEDDGYRVVTDQCDWRCRAVVIASGACNQAAVPALSEGIPSSIRQLSAKNYRNPEQLDQGRVLVVGASATGLQLAEEIHRSGRPVTLSVGEHVRMPRTYRGRDIQWWMHHGGLLDEDLNAVDDIQRVRKLPSPQLVGTSLRRTLDLNALSLQGVKLVGQLVGMRDGEAKFSGSLRNVCALADLKMNRLLNTIDGWIEHKGFGADPAPSERPAATITDEKPVLGMDLEARGFESVIWATGYRPDYSWLNLPVFDRKGQLRHDGGVVDAPGVYVMGLPFMRRRKSSFMHGAEDDARELSAHLKGHLDQVSGHNQWPIAV